MLVRALESGRERFGDSLDLETPRIEQVTEPGGRQPYDPLIVLKNKPEPHAFRAAELPFQSLDLRPVFEIINIAL